MVRNPRLPVILDARVIAGAGGGPEKTILNSPRFLEPAGYRNLCVYLHPPHDPEFEAIRRRAREARAPLIEIPDRGPFDFTVVSRLLNLCRREKVAIWHGHDYKSNVLGLLLARFWRMRLVTTVHGWVHHTSRTPLYYALDRLCLPRYRAVLCVSPDLRAVCLEVGVPAERCVLVENGIDTEHFSRRVPTARAQAEFGVPEGRTVLGAVGRLSPEKGFDLLLRALVPLLAEGHDLELWVVGAGGEGPALERLASELGLTGRVRFLGFRDDTAALFQAMDVFILSSHREGLPNVVLEALALGVPTVATAVGGVPELIRDGKTGILVAPGNPVELTRGVSRLLTNPPLRQSLALAGRQAIEQGYSFAARMDRVRRVYADLLPGVSA